MNPDAEKKPRYQPRRPRKSIKADHVHPTDYRRYVVTTRPDGTELIGGFFCEACSHFNSSSEKCTLGYRAQHRKADQMRRYEITGTLVLCRALEVD